MCADNSFVYSDIGSDERHIHRLFNGVLICSVPRAHCLRMQEHSQVTLGQAGTTDSCTFTNISIWETSSCPFRFRWEQNRHTEVNSKFLPDRYTAIRVWRLTSLARRACHATFLGPISSSAKLYITYNN